MHRGKVGAIGTIRFLTAQGKRDAAIIQRRRQASQFRNGRPGMALELANKRARSRADGNTRVGTQLDRAQRLWYLIAHAPRYRSAIAPGRVLFRIPLRNSMIARCEEPTRASTATEVLSSHHSPEHFTPEIEHAEDILSLPRSAPRARASRGLSGFVMSMV
jgi:hypothetical protein